MNNTQPDSMSLDPVWLGVSILIVLIVALLYRYELRFIRTLPERYKLSVIVANILHMVMGLGLLAMFVFRLYRNETGLHVLTWGIVVWLGLSAYIALSRPKLLIKVVKPDKEELMLLINQIKQARTGVKTDSDDAELK